MSKVVLSGYYGFNNAGDELILYSIIQTLRKIEPGIVITVLSNQPDKTARQYDVKSVSRWHIWSILNAVMSCDLLISGGGSLLQDVTSANSSLYYLGIIFLGKVLGKKTMIYNQGIGPLVRKRNRRLAAWLLNRLDSVTVRDEGSRQELAAMGVKKDIVVAADPVFGLRADAIELSPGQEILERNGVQRGKGDEERRLIGVFIRSWKDNKYLGELVKACDQLAGDGWTIVFVPMQFPQDIAVAKQATKAMAQEAICLKELYDPLEMLSITGNFDLILGMRLHALINGAVMNVPVVGLSYDPKIERFLLQIRQQSLNSVDQLNSQTLVELVNCIYNNREEIKEDLRKAAENLFQKSWQSARLAMQLLKKDALE